MCFSLRLPLDSARLLQKQEEHSQPAVAIWVSSGWLTPVLAACSYETMIVLRPTLLDDERCASAWPSGGQSVGCMLKQCGHLRSTQRPACFAALPWHLALYLGWPLADHLMPLSATICGLASHTPRCSAPDSRMQRWGAGKIRGLPEVRAGTGHPSKREGAPAASLSHQRPLGRDLRALPVCLQEGHQPECAEVLVHSPHWRRDQHSAPHDIPDLTLQTLECTLHTAGVGRQAAACNASSSEPDVRGLPPHLQSGTT